MQQGAEGAGPQFRFFDLRMSLENLDMKERPSPKEVAFGSVRSIKTTYKRL